MTPETALTLISIAGVVGTAFNMFLSLKISNSIHRVKLWVNENFIAKQDAKLYLKQHFHSER